MRERTNPLEWATLQNNKGAALEQLSWLVQGGERIQALLDAIACYDAALRVRRPEVAATPWARTTNNKGNVLKDLARTHDDIGRRKTTLGQSVACFDAILGHRDEIGPSEWAVALQNKAATLSDLAELQEEEERAKTLVEVIACYDAALQVRTREGSPAQWALSQRNKGIALEALARLREGDERIVRAHEAVACYDGALAVYARDLMPTEHRRFAQRAGILLFDISEWERAISYLESALHAVDDLFTLAVTLHGRREALAQGGDVAAHLAYALLRSELPDSAVRAAEALERGRARATGEAIQRQEEQIVRTQQVAPDLLAEFRQATVRLAQVAFAGYISGQDSSSAAGGLDALNRQLTGYEEARAARASYNDVVERIRAVVPDFLQPAGAIETVAGALRQDECLAFIAATRRGACAILFGRFQTQSDRLTVAGLHDERLNTALVEHLLTEYEGEGSDRRIVGGLLETQDDADDFEQALSNAVFNIGLPQGQSDGVLTQLGLICAQQGARRLVIVPCGLLGLLPLHAAILPLRISERPNEAFQMLADLVPVSYAPSARIWATCQRRARKAGGAPLHALIVGNPLPLPMPEPGSPRLSPLDGAEREARTVERILHQVPGAQVRPLLTTDASREAVLAALHDDGPALTHVHLACHGLADPRHPLASQLLLGGGTLTVRDLLDSDQVHLPHVRLAVLSACQTAISGTDLPDEAVGLPAGWLQAGAAGVVASMWLVSDKATSALMSMFYVLHILDGLEPVDALWLAQRWLQGRPTWRAECQAARATHAADQPEASQVLRGKSIARADKSGPHQEVEETEAKASERGWGRGRAVGTGQRLVDWAAFAIYGV